MPFSDNWIDEFRMFALNMFYINVRKTTVVDYGSDSQIHRFTDSQIHNRLLRCDKGKQIARRD